MTRTVTKKKRDESLPSYLPRVEKLMEGNDAQTNCSTHGPREVIGYDKTETLVYKRPEMYVLVRKYPKFACPGNPACGVASPERPTSLVEGDRYDTSVAAAVVEAKVVSPHANLPAPGRARRQWLDTQPLDAVEPREPGPVRDHALHRRHDRFVQQDVGVGIDDTGCRMLLPRTPFVVPGDAKSQRLAEKVAKGACRRRCLRLAVRHHMGLVCEHQ